MTSFFQGFEMKWNCRRTVFLVVCVGALGAAVACTGFFVNPTLSSIAVGPTVTIAAGKTVQLGATGTFSDGSTKSPLSGVVWNSSDTTVATVTDAGLVTGVAPGTSTITAAVGSVSGTATITVTLGNITSITIKDTTTNSTAPATINSGDMIQFQAEGMTSGGQTADITTSVTWAVQTGNTTGVSIGPNTGLLTTTSNDDGTVTVTATDPASGTVSNTFTVTISN